MELYLNGDHVCIKHITNREEAAPHAGGNVGKDVPLRADYTEYTGLNSMQKINPIFKSITNMR